MTIHTWYGDFESEEELIETAAKMMGISYGKAKKIREKALNDARKENERIEKAIQERKDLELSILEKIKARFPDLHFKPCPWCGEEPTIQVSVCVNYWLNKNDRPKDYRVEMKTCEHLNCTGHVLNWYKIDEIPEQPTLGNPEYRWDHWNENGWKWAVEDYKKYLSPDYERKCAECGVKWRGYDDYNVPYLNGKNYCWDCFNKRYRVNDKLVIWSLYRDIRNLSTMWDNGPLFYTSLEELLKYWKHTAADIYVKHKDMGDGRRGSDKLTGDIRGDRYEIYSRKPHYGQLGYVWEPDDKEELEKYLNVS